MLDVGIIREDTGAFFVKVRHVTTPHTVTDRATPGGVESANLTGKEGFFHHVWSGIFEDAGSGVDKKARRAAHALLYWTCGHWVDFGCGFTGKSRLSDRTGQTIRSH